jgi:hypothetical protein
MVPGWPASIRVRAQLTGRIVNVPDTGGTKSRLRKRHTCDGDAYGPLRSTWLTVFVKLNAPITRPEYSALRNGSAELLAALGIEQQMALRPSCADWAQRIESQAWCRHGNERSNMAHRLNGKKRIGMRRKRTGLPSGLACQLAGWTSRVPRRRYPRRSLSCWRPRCALVGLLNSKRLPLRQRMRAHGTYRHLAPDQAGRRPPSQRANASPDRIRDSG